MNARHPPDRSLREQPVSVLLAEDDDLVRDVMEMRLTDLGCLVTAAEDGASALQLLGERHFDVLVTDWMMPGMDGLELVQRVRGERSGEDYLHIIMMTARGQEETVRKALAAGVDDFLQKPVDPLQVELGIASARRVVELQRRLMRRNQRLAEANARIEADLDAAAEMQLRLLPEPELAGPISYAWKMKPSLSIGGDTLNVLRVGPERLLFFHLDVSGHGIPSALGSFMMNNRISLLAPSAPNQLSSVTTIVNRDMLRHQAGEAYLTLVIGHVDEGTGEVSLLRAGHPMPLLLRRDGTTLWIGEGGLPLGFFDDAEHELVHLTLEPGDRLILYSDGLIDSGTEEDLIGEDGLEQFARSHAAMPLIDFLDSLEKMFLDKWNGMPPEDDISVLILERSDQRS